MSDLFNDNCNCIHFVNDIENKETSISVDDNDSSHFQHLLEQFHQKRYKFCDVKILIGETTQILAHKIVLSSASVYFDELFSTDPTGNSNEFTLSLHESYGPIVEAIINFIYFGVLRTKTADLISLLRLSIAFKLDSLPNEIITEIDNNLSIENCINAWNIFNKFNYDRSNIIKYIVSNFLKISTTKVFTEMSAEMFQKFLQEVTELSISSSENLLIGLFDWIKFDDIQRKQYLYELIQLIPTKNLSKQFVIDNLSQNEILLKHFSCTKWLVKLLVKCLLISDKSDPAETTAAIQNEEEEQGEEVEEAASDLSRDNICEQVYLSDNDSDISALEPSIIQNVRNGSNRKIYIFSNLPSSQYWSFVPETYEIICHENQFPQLQNPIVACSKKEIFVLGGNINKQQSAILYSCTLPLNTWTKKNPANFGQLPYVAACALGPRLFLFSLQGVYEYNQIKVTLKKVAFCGGKSYKSIISIIQYGGLIYRLVSTDEKNCLFFESFNPDNYKFSHIQIMNNQNIASVTVFKNQFIFATSKLKITGIYDPLTKTGKEIQQSAERCSQISGRIIGTDDELFAITKSGIYKYLWSKVEWEHICHTNFNSVQFVYV